MQGEVRVLYPHNAKNGASCLTRFLSLGARMVEPPIANFGSGWMWDRNELNGILKNFVEAKEVWNHLEPKKLQYLLEIYNTVGGILGSNAPILASRSCFTKQRPGVSSQTMGYGSFLKWGYPIYNIYNLF